jgi:hypothetical protein
MLYTAALAALPTPAPGSPSQIVPAYFYPDGVNWASAASGSAPGSVLILNPASGPGGGVDPVYVNAARAAQAAGRQVIGYVPTGYGKRRAPAVRTDVRRYVDWYTVDGIFFDEAASGATHVRYYRDLYGFAKATVTPVVGPSTVVLNPGVVPDEGYMGASDVVITFENTLAAYDGATFASWTVSGRYGPERFGHLVHGVGTEDDMRRAVCAARDRGAARIYVTDDVMVNPWDRLPAYWAQERDAVMSGCAP